MRRGEAAFAGRRGGVGHVAEQHDAVARLAREGPEIGCRDHAHQVSPNPAGFPAMPQTGPNTMVARCAAS